MAPFEAAIDLFHAHTAPADWYEGLIKAYVGDGLAADFYREIAAYLDADDPRPDHRLAGGHGPGGLRRTTGSGRRSRTTRSSAAGWRCGGGG